MEISFKFLAPLRQVDLMETEIYKYLETNFRVQHTNMAENKRRKEIDLFLFEICFCEGHSLNSRFQYSKIQLVIVSH